MDTSDKKFKILSAAEELFAEHGFSGTSVREIAKTADVNIAMISYYFGSKENLLEAIFHYRRDYLQSKIDALISAQDLGNWEKLDYLVDEYVQKFSSNHCLHRIILREYGINNNQQIKKFINEQKNKHYQIIVSLIKQGQKDGDFSEDVDLIWLYMLLPGITKHVLFNDEFFREMISEEEGHEPTSQELMDRTKAQIKLVFRKFLEKEK